MKVAVRGKEIIGRSVSRTLEHFNIRHLWIRELRYLFHGCALAMRNVTAKRTFIFHIIHLICVFQSEWRAKKRYF